MRQRGEAAEVDAMGSSVGKKREPRGLGHALAPRSGSVWADVLGRRQDEVLLPRKALWEPCGITRYATDSWGASTRHREAEAHQPGKRHTQQSERTPLTWRTRITRLGRKTIGFARSTQLHDLVIGVLVKRYACGRPVCNRQVQIYNTTVFSIRA